MERYYCWSAYQELRSPCSPVIHGYLELAKRDLLSLTADILLKMEPWVATDVVEQENARGPINLIVTQCAMERRIPAHLDFAREHMGKYPRLPTKSSHVVCCLADAVTVAAQ